MWLRQGDIAAAIAELPDIGELDTWTEFQKKASLIAFAGEESRYRQLCQRVLEKFGAGESMSAPEQLRPPEMPLTPMGPRPLPLASGPRGLHRTMFVVPLEP